MINNIREKRSGVAWKSGVIAGFFIALLLVGVWCDPAMANKFETIGKGVTGTIAIKREYLIIIFWAVSGVFLVLGLLTIFIPKNNALMLNYSLWKQSAAIYILLSLGAAAAAIFI